MLLLLNNKFANLSCAYNPIGLDIYCIFTIYYQCYSSTVFTPCFANTHTYIHSDAWYAAQLTCRLSVNWLSTYSHHTTPPHTLQHTHLFIHAVQSGSMPASYLKGLTMIFAGQENPFFIFRSKEIYIYFKTNIKIPINLLK